MSSAIGARELVQAELAALVQAPANADVALLRILGQVQDLLQCPHAYDNGRPGSTLSFGVDALRAWTRALEALTAKLEDPKQFGNDRAWSLLAVRIMNVLNLPPSSATQRVRALIQQVCSTLDHVERTTELPSFASSLREAAFSDSESQANIIVQEALLAHYGLKVLAEAPQEFYTRVLFGIQQGFGSISKRSSLAITFMQHALDPPTVMDVWLDPLANCLCTAEERGVEHLVAHVVHPWLSKNPSTFPKLLQALEMYGNSRVVMSILQAAKVHDLCVVADTSDDKVCVPGEILDVCLTSSLPRMRVAALALCVDAKSPAMPLGPAEMLILHHFFQDSESMHLTSAVARKDTIALFVKMLVRIRTSSNKRKDEYALQMQEFLRTLFNSLAHALHPGAPYARTILAVSCLYLLLEATKTISTDLQNATMREGSLIDAVRALQKAQKTFPAAQLTPLTPTPALVHRLLCLATESTYDDIQSIAVLVLIGLAHRGGSFWDDPEFVWTHVVEPSLRRLTGTKESDAYAGVQLLKLYHEACAASSHVPILSRLHLFVFSEERKNESNWTCALLDIHLHRLETQLDEAAASLTHASCQGLHGTLAAISYLVSAAVEEAGALASVLVPFERLFEEVQRVWTLVMPVLCAAAPENADDHSELARAQEHEDDDTYDTVEQHDTGAQFTSVTSQRILSFSWRAMKEVAALLEIITRNHMTEQNIKRASDLFMLWLFRIRHRGAFSTVYPHYQSLARAICERGMDGPSLWLQACLDHADQYAASLSTTRRGAGLGFAVLALLSAHSGTKLVDLTRTCVSRLLNMAKGTERIRSIHALHILRVLVMDSTMAPTMKLHLGQVLACAVTSFQSVHWSVRNAAMMLFSVIIARYFGTNAFSTRGPGSHRRGARLETLWRGSETLAQALTDTLETYAGQEDTDLGYASALYAVLCLFSQSDASICNPSLLAAVERCTQSRQAALRALAAHCYAVLVPLSEQHASVKRLLQQATIRNQNALAGTLAVLEHWASPTYKADIESRMDLLTDNVCPVTLASFLQVARKCNALEAVKPWLASWIHDLLNPPWNVARDPFTVWLLPVALTMAMRVDMLPLAVLHADHDIRSATIDILYQDPAMLEVAQWDKVEVHNALMHTLLFDVHASLHARSRAAHLINVLGCELEDTHAQKLIVLAASTESVLLLEALLPLTGRAVRSDRSDMLEACFWIWDQCSHAEASPASRLGVAYALQHVHTSHIQKDLILLRLLHDDDSDVREAACQLQKSDHTKGGRFACIYALHRGSEACTREIWRRRLRDPAFHSYVWKLLVPIARMYS